MSMYLLTRTMGVLFNRCMGTTGWHKSYTEHVYVSGDNRYRAELRQAGYYSEFGCKLTRHYAIYLRGSENVVGTAHTLKEAKEMYL